MSSKYDLELALRALQQKPITVMHTAVQVTDEYTRGWSMGEFLTRWVCARCEERLIHDKDGYRKNRGKPAWVHLGSAQPWCKSDKQHGPKSRRAFPVPSLLVIEELGYLT